MGPMFVLMLPVRILITTLVALFLCASFAQQSLAASELQAAREQDEALGRKLARLDSGMVAAQRELDAERQALALANIELAWNEVAVRGKSKAAKRADILAWRSEIVARQVGHERRRDSLWAQFERTQQAVFATRDEIGRLEVEAAARRKAAQEARAEQARKAAAAAAAAEAQAAASLPVAGAHAYGAAPVDAYSAAEVLPDGTAVDEHGWVVPEAPIGSPAGGAMTMPSAGPLTSPFGPRWGRLHAGIDIGSPSGAPIYAAAAGTVSFAGVQGGYGNFVTIDHGMGLTTAYGHQSRIAVTAGQAVAAGQLIGYVGNTGHSTGPHLHFETRLNGTPVDPQGFFQ